MAFLTDSILVDSAIVFAGTAFIIYKYFTSSFGYWKDRGVPFIKPVPFFGNFADVVFFKATIGHCLADAYRQMNHEYFGIWVFGTPHLVIKGPEMIKQIITADFNYFSDRTIANDEKADSVISKLLFFLHNPAWKSMRAKLTPIFTSGKIKGMIPLMNGASEEMKHYLSEKAQTESSIEAKEVCAKFTTDVITSCAFGLNAESFRHENAAFRDIGRKMFDFTVMNAIRSTAYFFAPTLVKLAKLKFFEPSVNEFCRNTFTDTIREREKSGAQRHDLIDMIIELKKAGSVDGNKFEGDTIVATAVQFFAAGFETTSSTIAFTLYEMCIHTEMQQKLRTEINQALKEHEGVTYEAIQSMKYLDKIIKETLRKYPVLSFLDRRCIKNYKIPDSDVVIEKGTPVYVPLMGLHYDPKYFPEPDKFDPERFTAENISKRPAYAYLPFGNGPHNCIGERFGLIATKLGVIQVLSNFQVDRTELTPDPIVFEPRSFLLTSTGGLPMKFTKCN